MTESPCAAAYRTGGLLKKYERPVCYAYRAGGNAGWGHAGFCAAVESLFHPVHGLDATTHSSAFHTLVFGVAWANLFARDCPRNNMGKLLLAYATHNEP